MLKSILIALAFASQLIIISPPPFLPGPPDEIEGTLLPDGEWKTVQTYHDAASPGDVLIIPSAGGPWDWTGCTTQCVNVTKAITIRGEECGLDSDHRPTDCDTVIQDAPVANANYYLFKFTLPAGSAVARLAYLTLENSTRSATCSFCGLTAIGTITDDGRRWVLDHVKIDALVMTPHIALYATYGVAYHNTFISDLAGRRLANVNGYASATDYGDTPWAADTNLGTDKHFYWEDNYLEGQATSSGRTHIDAFGGARYVARYNDSQQWNYQHHGTESSGRYRSARATEIYRNSLNTDAAGESIAYNNRGGISMIWDNTYTGWGTATIQFNCDRSLYVETAWPIDSSGQTWMLGPPWGHANGYNALDANDAGNPIYSGTVATWTSGTRTITVSPDPGWAADQWVGYILNRTTTQTQPLAIDQVTVGDPTTVFRTTVAHGFTTGDSAYIAGITTTPALTAGAQWSITVVDADEFSIAYVTTAVSDQAGKVTIETASDVADSGSDSIQLTSAFSGSAFSFRVGEDFTLNKVTHCLDGPGRAKGTSMGGAFDPTEPGSNDQVTEGAYSWSNRADGTLVTFAGQVGTNYHTRPNVHVFNEAHADNPDCTVTNGTCGVIVDVIANQPETCTVGAGFWATDEGEWDSTNGATADGRLYKCTATNTWTLWYTPYTYPHPLATDN